MRLYELAAEYQAVLDEVADAEGVLDEDLEARLDAIAGSLADKVDSCCAVVRTLEAEASALKAEEARLAARRKTLANETARLVEYVGTCLRQAEVRKVRGARFTASLAKTPGKVALTVPEDQVPELFAPRQTVIKVDRRAIADALKAGEELGFAHLEVGERVAIR